MSAIGNIADFLSSGTAPGFANATSIELAPTALGGGGFGEVFECIAINGNRPITPQVIKVLLEDRNGLAARGFETIQKLQRKILARTLSPRTASIPIDLIPGLHAIPQFSFRGIFRGKTIFGCGSARLDVLGYCELDAIQADAVLMAQYHAIGLQGKLALAMQLAEAVQVLQELSYIHADINSKNVFVNIQQRKLAIIDFDSGAVTSHPGDRPTTFGKPCDGEWQAFEIARQLKQRTGSRVVKVDFLTDLWSIAVGIHNLIFLGGPLFYLSEISENSLSDYFEKQKLKWPDISKKCQYIKTSIYSQHRKYLDLLRSVEFAPIYNRLLHSINEGLLNPDARPTCSQWVHTIKPCLESSAINLTRGRIFTPSVSKTPLPAQAVQLPRRAPTAPTTNRPATAAAPIRPPQRQQHHQQIIRTQNQWAKFAAGFALLSLLPILHFLGGLAAAACGWAGLRQAQRSGGVGQLRSGVGFAVGLVAAFLSLFSFVGSILSGSTNSNARPAAASQTNTLGHGTIHLTSDPEGASVTENGRLLGTTPLTLTSFPAGSHEFEVTHPRLPSAGRLNASVSLKGGESKKAGVYFQYGTLHITSDPTGATVMNGIEKLGKTPLVLNFWPAEREKDGGRRFNLNLQLKDPGAGYIWHATIDDKLNAGQQLKLHAKMASRPLRIIAGQENPYAKQKVPDVISGSIKELGGKIFWKSGLSPHEYRLVAPSGLTDAVALAASSQFGLALKADGTLAIWGVESRITSNYPTVYPTTPWTCEISINTVPFDLSNIIAIAAAPEYFMALKKGGKVVTWKPGSTSINEGDQPPGINDFVAIAAGYRHKLGLTWTGRVVAWGDNHEGQATVPNGLDSVVAIAAGEFHSLALKDDGTVVAWGAGDPQNRRPFTSGGNNDDGQCKVPAGLKDVVTIAAGRHHSLAVRRDGTVVAWGGRQMQNMPSNLNHVVSVSGGGNYSIALKDDGTVVGWGDESDHWSRKLGDSSDMRNLVAISAGQDHCLALSALKAFEKAGKETDGASIISRSEGLPQQVNSVEATKQDGLDVKSLGIARRQKITSNAMATSPTSADGKVEASLDRSNSGSLLFINVNEPDGILEHRFRLQCAVNLYSTHVSPTGKLVVIEYGSGSFGSEFAVFERQDKGGYHFLPASHATGVMKFVGGLNGIPIDYDANSHFYMSVKSISENPDCIHVDFNGDYLDKNTRKTATFKGVQGSWMMGVGWSEGYSTKDSSTTHQSGMTTSHQSVSTTSPLPIANTTLSYTSDTSDVDIYFSENDGTKGKCITNSKSFRNGDSGQGDNGYSIKSLGGQKWQIDITDTRSIVFWVTDIKTSTTNIFNLGAIENTILIEADGMVYCNGIELRGGGERSMKLKFRRGKHLP